VPPQPEELKPFLIHGAAIAGKVNDAYFSIFRGAMTRLLQQIRKRSTR
jgi:hypothetical protein